MQKQNNKNKLELDKLMSENYYPVNITMVKYLGIDAALFFSAAYEQMDFMRADLNRYNTFSVKTASEKTGLSSVKQKKAIEVLKQHNLIDVCITPGYPKVRKISFNLSEIEIFKKELEDFKFKSHLEKEQAKYEFKQKVQSKKQEFHLEQHRKATNERWFKEFPELRELTDDPFSYVQEHKEWKEKDYNSLGKPVDKFWVFTF